MSFQTLVGLTTDYVADAVADHPVGASDTMIVAFVLDRVIGDEYLDDDIVTRVEFRAVVRRLVALARLME